MAKSVEQSITEYLEALSAPAARAAAAVVDREQVKALREQLKRAAGPLEKLDLAKALREAQVPKAVEPEPAPGEQVFVAEGRTWAEAHGYTAEDLLRYAKVPADVLRAAGFPVPRLAERGGSGRRRAPRLDLDEVAAVATELTAPWRLTDLAARLDRDVATTRNYVTKLVERGTVAVAGKDSSGRGRAATLYRSR